MCVYAFTDIVLSLTRQVDNPAMCSAFYMHFVALVQYIDSLTTIYHTFTQPGLVPTDVFTGGPSAKAKMGSTGQGATILCRAS